MDPAILTSENGIFSETDIVVSGWQAAVPEALREAVANAEALAAEADAPATVRAYDSDWRHFTAWCATHDLPSLPADPAVVCLYLSELEGQRATSTISRRLTTIRRRHEEARLDSPTDDPAVRQVWKGIRRRQGTRKRGKAAARTNDVRAMVGTLDRETLAGKRDAALLLIGFAGALRRSELVALDVPDVVETAEGLTVFIGRSKTDQEGEGYEIALLRGSAPDTCPVRALAAWREASGISEGAWFRSVNRHGYMSPRRLTDRSVALIVKRCALGAGLEPGNYAGHSLRSGMITTAAEAGEHERKIMDHSRHKSVKVMRGYIRKGRLYKDTPTGALGL